jgi:hypothetical protein
MLIVEFAYLEIASAAERYGTSLAKYLPKRLRKLYRSGGARAINGFTSSNSALYEIERQCRERSDFCHRIPPAARTIIRAIAHHVTLTGDSRPWEYDRIEKLLIPRYQISPSIL